MLFEELKLKDSDYDWIPTSDLKIECQMMPVVQLNVTSFDSIILLLKFSHNNFFFRNIVKGVSLSRTFKKSIFCLFQSMNLLSKNIVAKFYSSYQNSFDGRVPSSGLRRASGRFLSSSENFKARFLKTTFFKIACMIKGEPIKLLL